MLHDRKALPSLPEEFFLLFETKICAFRKSADEISHIPGRK